MSRRVGTSGGKKDVLLELVSRDIKELQKAHSESTGDEPRVFTEAEDEVQLLCYHLDHILMHGLKNFEAGYWPFVGYFTRTELIRSIMQLRRTTISLGKGRSWLFIALNEQSVESYVRMFAENQHVVQDFYLRDAFLRDMEHLLLLLTLVSGLDFISFKLEPDSDYLDYGASRLSSQITTHTSLGVTPTFLSSKHTDTEKRSRAHSDPVPKNSRDITGQIKGAREQKEREHEEERGEAISASFSGSDKTRNKSRSSRINIKKDNERVAPRDEVPEEESRLPMMSSSMQITPSRNVLERMSSLDKRSPFLERASLREGAWPTSVRVRGGEEVKGENAEEDELVARGRKSGRSKKRRKKRNEEMLHKPSSNGHVTDNVDHRDGAILFHPESNPETGHLIPTRDPQFTGMGECDFETEQRAAVNVLDVVEEAGMNLEMELALAMREGSLPSVSGTDGHDGHQLECDGGHQLEPSILASQSSVRVDQSTTEEIEENLSVDNLSSVQSDEKGAPQIHTVTPSHTHQNKVLSTRQPQNTAQPSQPDAGGHLKSPDSQLSTRPTSHDLSHSSELDSLSQSQSVTSSKALGEPARERGREPARERRRERVRRERPDFEEDYDIVTEREMRAIDVSGRRRANALHSVESEREAEEMVCERERAYREPPKRPSDIIEKERAANDVKIDENMKVVFSIEVYLPDKERLTPPPESPDHTPHQHAEEDAMRLIRVRTPTGLGQYQPGYVLITTHAVYMLRRDGIEGIFCREFGTRFRNIDHLVIGLGWQSVELVYREGETEVPEQLQHCVFVTGSEAVSRSLMDSIQRAATQCPGFERVIPRNRDDEWHLEAIEKELIKLGSETSMDVVQYSLVNWEQVKGRQPEATPTQPIHEVMSGLLYYKKNSRVGLSSWKQGFFRLIDGTLHQFSSETDKVSRGTYSLTGCGGCSRVAGENRQFVLSVALKNTPPLLLATATEEEMTQWQQALCEAVLQVSSSDQCRNLMCTVLLTNTKVHILQEDMLSGSVSHITCCEVTAVERVTIDQQLPLYCTVSYDDGPESKGVWLLCFISEYELGKFESALADLWKEEFQIDLPFSEVQDAAVKQRAHHTIELMNSSSLRSDSITKGRTEFTYSSTF